MGNTLHNVFLSAQLNSEFVQDQIQIRTGQVTIGKLALHRIKSISVLVPPFNHQLHFAEIVKSAQAAAEMADTSMITASTLSEALVSRLL